MKDIAFIMEQCTRKHLKYLFLTYGLEILLFICLIAINAGDTFYGIALLVVLLCLFRYHQTRIKSMVEEGALTRILLLPLKRRSYMWSEVIFTTTTVCVMFMLLFAIWILGNAVFQPSSSISAILLHAQRISAFRFLFPYGLLHLMTILMYVVLLGLLTLTLALGLALKDKKASGIGGMLYFLWMNFLYGYSSTLILWISLFGYMIYICICLYDLNILLGFKRKKVNV